MAKATKQKGLKSLAVLRQRHIGRKADRALRQKKIEMALKSELTHRLEVQFSNVDVTVVMLEVQDNVLATFMIVLEDTAITSLYEFDQVGPNLFEFRLKELM